MWSKLGAIKDPSGAVHTSSKKEKGVTSDSATIAEAKSAFKCMKTTIVLRNLLEDMGAKQHHPTVCYQDNKGLIDTLKLFLPCKDNLRHERRMISAMQRMCQIEPAIVRVEYIKSAEQPADMLTKFISTIDHLRQLEMLLGKQQGITDLIDLHNKKKFARQIHRVIEIHHVHCSLCLEDITRNNTSYNTNNNHNNNQVIELPEFVPQLSTSRRPSHIKFDPFTKIFTY